MKTLLKAWMLILLTLFPYAVYGLEFDALLSSSINASNNINKSGDDEIADALQSTIFRARAVELRKSFQTDASFTLQHEHYFKNTYENEANLTAGVGILNFDLIESFLSWHTSYNRVQVLNDPLEDDEPNNRSYRDILQTGPSISYDISRSTQLSLSASYINTEFSRTDANDTERVVGALLISRFLNPVSQLDLSFDHDSLLDADGGEEFRTSKAALAFHRKFSNGNAELKAGYARIDSDIGDVRTGRFYKAEFGFQRLLSHDVVLGYQSDLSDTSRPFDIFAEEGASQNSFSRLDLVEERSFYVDVSRVIGTYQYSIYGRWSHEDFETQNEDEVERLLGLSIGAQLDSGWSGGVSIDYRQDRFLGHPEVGVDYVNIYSIDSEYRFSSRFSMTNFIKFEKRRNAADFSREYYESSLGIELSWVLD